MNKFTTFSCVVLIGISGCNSLLGCKGKEAQLPPAVAPGQIIATFTPELDVAKGSFPKPADDKKEQPVALVEPVAQQFSESFQFYLFNEEMGHFSISTEHQPTSLGDDDDLDLGIIRPDVRDEWTASTDTGRQAQPSDLWKSWFATDPVAPLNDGWIVGKGVSIGISEAPFDSLNATLTTVNAFLTVPQGKNGHWLFGMSYAGAVKQPYLIPRIEYIWQPSQRMRANMGVMVPSTNDPVFDFSLGIWR